MNHLNDALCEISVAQLVPGVRFHSAAFLLPGFPREIRVLFFSPGFPSEIAVAIHRNG